MKEKLRKLLNYIFTITQIILLFGVNITCFAADPLMQYTYKFSYEKGQGDYYIGTVFAPKSYGYSVGYTKYTVDENGKEGYYTISTQSKVTNSNNKGKVFVSSYYDKESDKSYTPLDGTNAAGTNYLGVNIDILLTINFQNTTLVVGMKKQI